MTPLLLAGDVGGTKARLGLFSLASPSYVPLIEQTYPSADFPSLEAVVRKFLKSHPAPVTHASFGVAGPVMCGRVKMLNLPWVIEEASLSAAFQLSGANLINDVEAIATSVPFLRSSETFTLNVGTANPEGTTAVIAPGTGLGEAFITNDGSKYRAFASEGGHTDFAPTNKQQVNLLEYLLERFDHVSYERVCSGIGIMTIHGFFETTCPPEHAAHRRELAVDDPVPAISKAALAENCEACEKTLDVFVTVLAAEAANLALKVLATGGVYIAGGIPRKILPLLKKRKFMRSFTRKGRYSNILADIPIRVVLNPSAGLLGAARSGIEIFGNRRGIMEARRA